MGNSAIEAQNLKAVDLSISGQASGDHIYFDGSNWVRRPIPRFKAYNSGNIGLTDRVNQKYAPDAEIVDEGGYFDVGTSRYTPLVAGVYYFYFFWGGSGNTLEKVLYARIWKNGANTATKSFAYYGSTAYSYGGSAIITAMMDMNGTTDYVEFYAQADHLGGTTNQTIGNGPGSTQCGGFLVA